MEDYTIYEEYTLPSQGKIYEEEVNPVVKLRSMTTNEEMRRLSQTDRPYKVHADILDACIVEPIGISAYDLCIGDFEYLMHKLRVTTYGPEYKLEVICPKCLISSEETIDLNDLGTTFDYETVMENIEFELPKSKHKVRLKIQTPRMLDQVKIDNDQFKRGLKDKSIGDTSVIFILKGMINTVDGEKLNPISANDWIRKLPMMDTTYILQKAMKINEAIGINSDIEIKCDFCGQVYKAPFRITPEFFSPTLL